MNDQMVRARWAGTS